MDRKSTATVIAVKDLTKRFSLSRGFGTALISMLTGGRIGKPRKTIQALDNINLEIFRGEKVGIIGRNGSGKTTLMRMVAGIYPPTHGSVKVAGKIASMLQLGIGTIGRLTVSENIYLYAAIMGLTRRETQERYDQILDFAELHDFEDAQVGQLSSGMNQRLTFSVAIQVDADVLLLDEVLAVGDQTFKNKCYQVFEDRLSSNTTLLFCSHDLKEVSTFCTRTIWLEGGKVVEFGDTDDIMKEYKERHGFPLGEESDEETPPVSSSVTAS